MQRNGRETEGVQATEAGWRFFGAGGASTRPTFVCTLKLALPASSDTVDLFWMDQDDSSQTASRDAIE